MALADDIRTTLRDLADPEAAPGMAAYMKVIENGTLPYLGVRRPVLRRAVRALARRGEPERLVTAVAALWDEAEWHEERYAAQDLLGMPWSRGRIDLLDLHRHHVVTGRWWDHTDETAHRIADLVDTHPAVMAPVLRTWACEENVWLRRVAILGQLGLRDRVDLGLLTDVIEPNLTDGEFFIRKAIGWALREVARWDSDWVQTYAATHDLSPLSRREALKHIPA